jgi:hypothetical protein
MNRNGQTPVAAASWIMQQRHSSKWSFIARPIPEARPLCAALSCSFAAIFGLHCLGQAWKKASLGSGRLSPQRFGRSTRNIWSVCRNPSLPQSRSIRYASADSNLTREFHNPALMN